MPVELPGVAVRVEPDTAGSADGWPSNRAEPGTSEKPAGTVKTSVRPTGPLATVVVAVSVNSPPPVDAAARPGVARFTSCQG